MPTATHVHRFASPRKVRQWCLVLLVFVVIVLLIKTWPKSIITSIRYRDSHELFKHRTDQLLRKEFVGLIRDDIPAVEDVGEAMLNEWTVLENQFCAQIFSNRSYSFATDACRYSCEHKDYGTGTSDEYGRRNLVVIPFRDRHEHLKQLVPRLEHILQKQKICYLIVVSEQIGTEPFNKGMLMNAAFVEALRLFPFHCITLHDVDLLALSDDTPYGCPTFPQHTSVHIDKFRNRLPYIELVGGILSLPIKVFLRVNGFSNLYWGWGAEDDDMYERLTANGIPVTRPDPTVSMFKMLRHSPSPSFPLRLRYVSFIRAIDWQNCFYLTHPKKKKKKEKKKKKI
ncbi:Beta 14 N acetylgalactosaminyltransferase [Fasciola gigantica]|uniref:Beta-1,4-galactosyltransferase n=1 Tax=Fasciola gigantica TaxID=46835 RepID=A0A504YTB4_FASGI|nr:Beta 14 N acetylgalactosaminyltransferase [Fasciola gigantica]